MAKKRRPPNNTPEPSDPVNNERIRSGEIPWSFEGVSELLEHAAKLRHTPRDDWDRKRRGIAIQHEDGTVSSFSFNPDMPINQLGHFLVDKFRKEGLDRETTMSHLWRFMEIQAFLSEHAEELRRERLIIDDESDPNAALISGGLLRALATSRYEGVRLAGGDPSRTFHVTKVIEAAKTFDLEDDSKDAPE